ncbi:MAG: peptidylprolyl isomerase [Steroidobacteraceae bacterium]
MSKPQRFGIAAAAAAGLLLLLATAQAATAPAAAPAAAPQTPESSTNPRVEVYTSMGDFVIELFPKRAPLTVKSFLQYVHDGQYTNTLFHRVIANFVIQGGGHSASAPYALKPIHGYVPNESGNGLSNKRGMVGLARANAPHTGNCQFYINLVDNPELDPLPTRWGYAIFGEIVEGMDVVDRIGVTPTGSFGPFNSNAPLKPVVIEKIVVIPAPSDAAAAPTQAPLVTTPASLTPPVLSPR